MNAQTGWSVFSLIPPKVVVVFKINKDFAFFASFKSRLAGSLLGFDLTEIVHRDTKLNLRVCFSVF